MKLFKLKIVLTVIISALAIIIVYGLVFKLDLKYLPAIPLPVVIVNGQSLKLNDFKDLHNALSKNVGVDKKQINQKIINKFLEQVVIEKIANQEKINPISLNDKIDLSEDAEAVSAEKIVNENYGWSMEKFNRLIIKPLEVKRGVANWYYQNNNQPIKQGVVNVWHSLKKENNKKLLENFNYLGFVELKSLEPLLQIAVISLKPGQISDLIESTNAYNLIYLQSSFAKEGLYEISLFSRPKKLFQNWLDEQIKQIYYWSFVK